MVEANKKEIIIRVSVMLSIYLGLLFAYPLLDTSFNSAVLKFNQKIANSYNSSGGFNNKNIVFEVQNNELISYIKNPIKQKGVAADTSYTSLDIRTHIYMPFVFMISLLSTLKVNRKKMIIFLSLGSVFLFVQFKIWIYILDQSNHFLIITNSGEYISKLKEGFFENIYNTLNIIINVKGALFIRYLYPIIIFFFLYLMFGSEKKIKIIK